MNWIYLDKIISFIKRESADEQYMHLPLDLEHTKSKVLRPIYATLPIAAPKIAREVSRTFRYRYEILSAIIISALLLPSFNYSFAGQTTFTPSVCLGSYENPKHASGQPDSDGIISTSNAAYLAGDKIGDLECTNFTGEIPANSSIADVSLTINISRSSKNVSSTPETESKLNPAKTEAVINLTDSKDVSANENIIQDNIPLTSSEDMHQSEASQKSTNDSSKNTSVDVNLETSTSSPQSLLDYKGSMLSKISNLILPILFTKAYAQEIQSSAHSDTQEVSAVAPAEDQSVAPQVTQKNNISENYSAALDDSALQNMQTASVSSTASPYGDSSLTADSILSELSASTSSSSLNIDLGTKVDSQLGLPAQEYPQPETQNYFQVLVSYGDQPFVNVGNISSIMLDAKVATFKLPLVLSNISSTTISNLVIRIRPTSTIDERPGVLIESANLRLLLSDDPVVLAPYTPVNSIKNIISNSEKVGAKIYKPFDNVEYLNIYSDKKLSNVEIYNATSGELVLNTYTDESELRISPDPWSEGDYIALVHDDDVNCDLLLLYECEQSLNSVAHTRITLTVYNVSILQNNNENITASPQTSGIQVVQDTQVVSNLMLGSKDEELINRGSTSNIIDNNSLNNSLTSSSSSNDR